MEMSNKYVFILAGFLVGILAGFLIVSSGALNLNLQQDGITKEEASSKVKEALKLANNQNVEISAVTKENDLWKVIVKGNNNMREFYLTKNGEFLISNPIKVDSYIEQTGQMKNFTDCLADEEVRFFGDNRNSTIIQIQILGGVQNVQDIFYNLNNQTTRYLMQNKVRKVPAFEINGTFYTGIKNIEFFEEKTSCKLN